MFIEIYGRNTARRHSPFVNFWDTYSTAIIICYTTTIYFSKNWVLTGGFFSGGGGDNFSWGKFFRLTFFLRGFFPGFFSWWLFFGEHIFGHQKQCTYVINKNKQEGTISCARKSEGYIKFLYFNSRTEQPYCILKFKRIYSVK